jgi:hypothetical protein
MNKFSILLFHRLVPTGLLALVAAVWLAPTTASATPVNYAFTVTATSGPLGGTVSHGTFSYDSSIITPNKELFGPDLLTALEFTWNGTTYNLTTANTGWLFFSASGQLAGFGFAKNCGPNCFFAPGQDSWLVTAGPGSEGFRYSLPGPNPAWGGTVKTTPNLAALPEPAALGMFGFGVLLIGAFVGLRRRVAQSVSRGGA